MSVTERYRAQPIPLSKDLGRRFLYARYSADLSGDGLARLGFRQVDPQQIQRMDAVENMQTLLDIGRAAGQKVDLAHFGRLA
jgi:hypothetical protein